MTMDDRSLAVLLGLTDAEAARVIPKLSPERRAAYEAMAGVEADLNMSVTPPGVIVCKPRRRWFGRHR